MSIFHYKLQNPPAGRLNSLLKTMGYKNADHTLKKKGKRGNWGNLRVLNVRVIGGQYWTFMFRVTPKHALQAP
jgi:hypothetical protein